MSDTYSIGVDLGATNLRIASYSDESGLLESILLPTRLGEGHDRVIRDLCEAIASLKNECSRRRLVGIGIGTPGPLELPEGILRNPPNLPGWDNFDLRSAVEKTLGHSVEVESDANTAAFAEMRLGAGRKHGVDSLCVLTLGTGVGNGLVLEKNIWHGSTGMGGEAGHCVVRDENGEACGCGGSGCLEQYASATAIVRMARERMAEEAPTTAHGVFLLASQGEPRAISVFQTVGHSLAIGLTGLVNTLNLPLYLLAGGVSEAWEMFAPAMFGTLRDRSYVYRLTEPENRNPEVLERHKTYILRAQLGASASLLGACLLPYRS
jgi:glucokinase